MRPFVLAALCAGGLVACSQAKSPAGAAASGSPAAPVAATAAGVAVSTGSATPVTEREVTEENDLIDFSYKYPAAAGAIPALKAALDADIATKKADLVKEATAGRKDAKEGGFDYHAYGYWHEWKVVTDLPGWLSLSAEVGTYEGGAHPNHGYDSLVWDKQSSRRLAPEDMFVSKAALTRVIRTEFCRQLDAQRKERRGADWKMGGEFDECIDPVETSTIILGSSNRMAFDRVGVLVPPYAAGPYAEGDYEITLPVTAAILAAVKPEYRPTFVVKR